jgi:deoxyribonuclease-4
MIGSHTSIGKDLKSCVKSAAKDGMGTIQVFLGSPYLLKRKQITDFDVDPSVNVFSHLPYVYNLAGSIKNNAVAWQGHDETDKYIEECLTSIDYELDVLSKLKCPCKGCVLHIGSCKDKQLGLDTVAKSINKLDFRDGDAPLLLETMVGNGSVLGRSFEDLARVYEGVEKKERVGICIDTCHVFASGEYDLSKEREVDRMFEEFDNWFPRDKCKLIHLNDSKGKKGDCKDNHQWICKGEIWGEDDSALVHLLRVCKHREIPVVLETAKEDFANLQEIYKRV